MWVWLISIDPGTWLYAEWLHITPVMEGKGISFCHDCFLSVKIRRRTYTLQRATREDVGKMSRSFLIGWQWLAAQRTPGQFSESCTKTREKWGYHPLETAVVILTHKSQNSRWHTIILVNTVHQIQDKHVHISFFFSHIDRWKKKNLLSRSDALTRTSLGPSCWLGCTSPHCLSVVRNEDKFQYFPCIILVSHSRLLVAFPRINYWAIASQSLVCCYLKQSLHLPCPLLGSIAVTDPLEGTELLWVHSVCGPHLESDC